MYTQLLNHVQFTDPMDCSRPGSSVHGIFQARILEWVAISYSDIRHKILEKIKFFKKFTEVIFGVCVCVCVYVCACVCFLFLILIINISRSETFHKKRRYFPLNLLSSSYGSLYFFLCQAAPGQVLFTPKIFSKSKESLTQYFLT